MIFTNLVKPNPRFYWNGHCDRNGKEKDDMSRPTLPKTILTETLEIAFEDSGATNGKPVILLHGFPDDPRSWDSVVDPLTAAGFNENA
jgi:hypothetical protein